MDISPIRVARAQCCAHLVRLRWGSRVPQQRCQGTERGEVDSRISHDAPVRAGRSVEHPGRNLQPPMQCLARKGAAENRRVLLVDNLVDKDLPSGPGMARVKKLALKADPVGVPSSSCTTADARTRRSTAGRLTRSMIGGNDGATGGVETNKIHLSQAAKLSHQAGPPLLAIRSIVIPGAVAPAMGPGYG